LLTLLLGHEINLQSICNYLHGAEHFSRCRQLCSHSRAPQHFKKHEDTLRIHKCSPMVPFLSQINPARTTHRISRTSITMSATHVLVFLMVSFFWNFSLITRVKWVPCHHGMERLQVADTGDGIQIWREAADLLYKLRLTENKGLSYCLGVARWAKTPHLQNKIVTKYLKESPN
jgi:hypothetical protein